jgi:hypothetical protein
VVNPFTAAAYSLAVFAGLGGACILIFRERLLRFVRQRFEKIHHEDGLIEAEIDSRLPRMWVVVLIGLGWLVVAAVAAGAGWAS